MLRALIALLAGTASGVAAVLIATDGADTLEPDAAVSFASITAPTPDARSIADTGADSRSPSDPASELISLARQSPAAALAQFAGLDYGLRLAMLDALARELARSDPVGALRLIGNLGGDVEDELRDAVLARWSLYDPAALVAWLGSIESASERLALFHWFPDWMSTLAASAPELVFQSAASVPGDHGSMLRALAIRAVAEVDPYAAAGITEATRDRADRDRYAVAIGSVLGAHDPDVALEWLRGMEAPHWNAIDSVLMGVAEADLELAIDLLLNDPMTQIVPPYSLPFSPANVSADTAPRLVATIVDSLQNPRAQSLLGQVVEAWAEHDIDAAIDWVLVNEAILGPGNARGVAPAGILGRRLGTSGASNMLTRLAGDYARRGVEAALDTAGRLPPEHRGAWIQAVLDSVGRTDAALALRLLEPYRGESLFEPTYERILMSSTMMGSPQTAIRLLENATPQSRERLLPMLAQSWGGVDPVAASGWARSLPAGAERDRVLGYLLTGSAASGAFDASLLADFSDPVVMQDHLRSAVVSLGQVDETAARRVIDEQFADEAERAQAAAALDRVLQMRSRIVR